MAGTSDGHRVACHWAEEIQSGRISVADPALLVEPELAAPAPGLGRA